MLEEAVSAAASICVFLEELQIREDESGRRKEQKSWSPLYWRRVWCALAWQAGIWAIVTFIVQRAVTKLNPPTAMNVDYDLCRNALIYRGGRVLVEEGVASGHTQRSMVFQCQKLTDSVECSTRPARGWERPKYFIQTLSRGLLCPQNLQEELSPCWAECLLEEKMRIWVRNSK